MARGAVDGSSQSVTISDFKDLEQMPLSHTIYRAFIFMPSPAGKRERGWRNEACESDNQLFCG